MKYEDFVTKARVKHGDKYEYPTWESEVTYHTKVRVVCLQHGEFLQRISDHLRPYGCPVCGAIKGGSRQRLSYEEFVARARKRHGDRYAYVAEDFAKASKKTTIICPEHGRFQQTPTAHLAGRGCLRCKGKKISSSRSLSYSEVATRISEVTGGRYSLLTSEADYSGSTQRKVVMYCAASDSRGATHGAWEVKPNNILCGGALCPKCQRSFGHAEGELREFVQSLGFIPEKLSAKVLGGETNHEFDIVILTKKLAIEYNGLVWHSERFKADRNYHLDKTNLASGLGLSLIHVFEDEWLGKRSIVKARIRQALGVPEYKTAARKTGVVKLSEREAREFLEETHLQGAGPRAVFRFGLVEASALVAVATFGPARFGNSGWELYRLAFRGQVVGGASKLLAAFRQEPEADGKLISFSDRRWGAGGVYASLGFSFVGHTPPSYFYVKGQRRLPRQMFQKHKLQELFGDKFDPSLTEVENCRNNGYHRIFDCGHSKWSLTL